MKCNFKIELELDPMPFMLKHDQDMVNMYVHVENELPGTSGSKVVA